MAAPRVSIDLVDDTALQARLRALTPRLEKAALRSALRESGRPMLAAAKALAPVRSGDLRKALRIRAFRRSRKNRVGVYVGSSSLASEYQGKQFYGAFQEYGWRVGKRPWRSHRGLAHLQERLAAWRAALANPHARLSEKARRHAERMASGIERQIDRRSIDTRKFIEGKKYLRRAYDQTKWQTLEDMRGRILKAIDVVVGRDLKNQYRKSLRRAG